MKLLLTSNGLSNNTIAKALAGMVGKKPSDTKVSFIPTAANPVQGDKGWLIDDISRIKQRGYQIFILDLAVISPKIIKAELGSSDIVFVGGGNSFYLSYHMQKCGMFDYLPEMLKTKVYAGISAGSMITGESLRMASAALSKDEKMKDDGYDELGPIGESSAKTLKLVNFLVRPHLNSEHFPKIRKDYLEEAAKSINAPVYAIDDNTAIKVIDDSIEVVTEGEWLLLKV